MKIIKFLILVIVVLNSFGNGSAAKILGVFPFPVRSHNTLGIQLMKGLAEKGHEIVFVTPMSHRVPKNLNYTEVLLEDLVGHWQANTKAFFEDISSAPYYKQLHALLHLTENITRGTIENENFKNLLKTHQHFDAVIIQQFHLDALKYLAWHYKAPLIVFNPFGVNGWVNHLTCNPMPSSYIPEMYTGFGTDMTFFQRIQNSIINLSMMLYIHHMVMPMQKQIYDEYFPEAPPFYDVLYNTSLMMLISDISTYPAVPKVPNMIDIGGFHIQPSKKIPNNLQTFLDGQKQGVIYFSMGSNIKSSDMTPELRSMFLRVFSRLNVRVLWKYETDDIPALPENVKIGKWFPQQEILGHPNIKLFITHGGLLSTTEAVYHGVPVLALPVFVDQYLNSKTILNNGFGLTIKYSQLNDQSIDEDYLFNTLKELLYNPRFSKIAKEISRIFHDKPMTPMDTANFWIEYVIRHKGAPHLRVGGLNLKWYQYFLLDVITFVLFVIVFVVFIIVCFLRNFFIRNAAIKVKKN